LKTLYWHSAYLIPQLSIIFVLMKPIIEIEYCPKCGWMLRAAYFAQELLITFSEDVHGVMLHPSETNGTFRIRIDGNEIFDRMKAGGFPEVKELKQAVRDVVNPEKHLGHSDNKNNA
jgi:selenoprotein W-related protein